MVLGYSIILKNIGMMIGLRYNKKINRSNCRVVLR